jgi:hypothetical protein
MTSKATNFYHKQAITSINNFLKISTSDSSLTKGHIFTQQGNSQMQN